MPRKRLRLEVPFNKGLWTAQNYNELPDGALASVSNLMLGPGESSVMMRKGFANVGVTNWLVGGKYDYFCSFDGSGSSGAGGTATGFYAFTGTNVYRQGYVSGAWTAETAALAFTVTHSVEYGDYVWFALENGTVRIGARSTVGTGVVTVTDASYPTINTIFTHKERVWGFFCNGTAASRLRYTILSPTTGAMSTHWPAANFIDVSPGDGEILIGAAPLNDRVVLFKNKSTYTLFTGADPTTWRLQQINNYVGCTSRYSVVEYQNWIYFASTDGIYRTDGITVVKISKALDYVFEGRKITRTNDTQYDFAGLYDGHYIISLKDTPNTIYLYHFETGTWWQWDIANNYGLGFFTNFTDGSGVGEALFAVCTKNSVGTPANAFLGRMTVPKAPGPFVWQDNATDYAASLKTKSYTLGFSDTYKRLNAIDSKVVGRGGTVTLTPVVDDVEKTSLAYAALTTGVHLLRAPAMNMGRTIGAKVAFSGTFNTGEEPGIFDIGLDYATIRNSPFGNA